MDQDQTERVYTNIWCSASNGLFDPAWPERLIDLTYALILPKAMDEEFLAKIEQLWPVEHNAEFDFGQSPENKWLYSEMMVLTNRILAVADSMQPRHPHPLSRLRFHRISTVNNIGRFVWENGQFTLSPNVGGTVVKMKAIVMFSKQDEYAGFISGIGGKPLPKLDRGDVLLYDVSIKTEQEYKLGGKLVFLDVSLG